MKHIKEKQSVLFSSKSLVLFTFLFNLIWVFQGIDIKDTGIHVANQNLLLPLSSEFISSLTFLTFLSDLVGGLWLHSIDFSSMLWVRLGYLLLISLCSLLSYSVLSYYFSSKKVWISCAATAIFIPSTNLLSSINYDTFPSLIICIIIFIVHKITVSRSQSFWFYFYIFLAGFVFTILVFSRIPAVVGIIAGILVVIYALLVKTRSLTIVSAIAWFIFGMILSAAIFIAIIKISGIYNQLISGFSEFLLGSSSEDLESHSIGSLLKIYFNDFAKFVVVISVIFIGFIYFFSFILVKIGKVSTFTIFLGLLVCGLFFGYYHYRNNAFLVHYTTRWAIGFIIWIIVAQIIINGRRLSGLVVLSIVVGFSTILPAMGSDTALGKSNHGMWVSLPLAILLGWEMQTRVKSKRIQEMSAFIPPILGMVFVLGFVIRLTWQYKEVDNRFIQNVPFKFPAMKGIYSHASRTKALDEVLFEIKKRSKTGSPVIIEPCAPLLYYLSGTVPAFKTPYIKTLSLEKRIERYNSTLSTNKPEIVVLSLVNPKSENWPIESADDSDFRSNDEILIELRKEIIQPLGMKLLWTNHVFEVYGLPNND